MSEITSEEGNEDNQHEEEMKGQMRNENDQMEEKGQNEEDDNEFQLFNKFVQYGQQNNSTKHFTRSKKPAWTTSSALAAMQEVVGAAHPKDFVAASEHPRRREYLEATRREMMAHHKNQSFEVISEEDLPPDANVINTGMIYTDKIDGMTHQEVIKARLCAKGYAQIYGDYTETYAPTVDVQCVRAFIAFAVRHNFVIRQMDVDAAFLIPTLPKHEIVYSNPPKGFELMCKKFDFLKPFMKTNNSRVFFRWLKSVYGLKSASYHWNKLLSDVLKRLGFEQTIGVDPCLYVRREKDGTLHACLLYHVDDLLGCGKNDVTISFIEEQVGEVLPIKLMGQPKRFIGIEFHYCDNGDVILHQESYLLRLLHRFGMEECSTVPSPATGERLPIDGEDVGRDTPFLEAIGEILWAAIMTRPDLLQAATQVAQYTSNFKMVHWQAIKRIFRYISGTKHFGIRFVRDGPSSDNSLIVYCDADHAGDPDRKSYMGNISFAWGGPIAWTSKKIRSISLSAHESELVAMSRTSAIMKWQVRMMATLMGKHPNIVQLLCDNQGARVTAVNGIRSRRSKHIEIADLYVLQAVEEKLLEIKRVDSKDNLADFLTKPLGPQKFVSIIRRLGLDGRATDDGSSGRMERANRGTVKKKIS